MDKQAVPDVLQQIAAFLELKGEHAGQARAYQSAARAVAAYAGPIEDVKGLDPATLDVVRDLLNTGRSSLLDELREQVPPGLVEMLRIPGLGVAKVRQIHEALGLESLTELEEAAADGRLARLARFGERTADNVRRGIAALRQASEVRLFHHARAEAVTVQRALRALDGVRSVEIAGSVRRRLELIRDLDVVVVADPGARDALVKRLGEAPGVIEFVGKGDMVTLRFVAGTVVDVFLATPETLGLAWVRATGSATHVAQLEERARTREIALELRAFPDEAGVYRALGLPWIPPELREGLGEIAAADAGMLPAVVDRRDLKGFIHCHTNYSDGTTTVAQWADACRDAGYEWVGITDHSQAAPYAGGLSAADVPRQHAEIDAVNRTSDGFQVLKGVEADILADGSLDYGPEVLDRFDFVIGSIHSRFGMTERDMTARVLTAMDDPHLSILGHPTGRLLLSREPFAIDLDQVLARAAERGVAVEVNADPHRLDLDWRLVRQARDAGVTISIGADAHSVTGMDNVDIGLGVARKGWVEARQVLNARDAKAFLAFARGRRS